jgi:hypothetical protein
MMVYMNLLLFFSLVLIFVTRVTKALCEPVKQREVIMKPFMTAVADCIAGADISQLRYSDPETYIMTNCSPPEPSDIGPHHIRYEDWLVSRKCHKTLVTSSQQLEQGSLLMSGKNATVRRSLRATPATISVEWKSLDLAVNHTAQTLWPETYRRLSPELQAVLTYRKGDIFGRHIDQCEKTGQEGVLVVDLGFRKDYESSAGDGTSDLYFYGLRMQHSTDTIYGTARPGQVTGSRSPCIANME